MYKNDLTRAVEDNNVKNLIKLLSGSKNVLMDMDISLVNRKYKECFPQGFPSTGVSLLHVAALNDSLECFLFLIKQGVSPSIMTPGGVFFYFI